jgi:Lon protease-like protein
LTVELPLFPLHTVLFPGRPLPLHVFEPRYRLMIGRCLERASPFGVVLIRAGLEVGDPAEPYAVGTTAEIVEHERLPDGRMHLLCVGRERFRVRALLAGEPYLQADVGPLADDPPAAELEGLAARLAAGLGAYVGPGGLEGLTLPDDPTALSFAAPAALPLGLPEQQRLLEMTSTEDRLRWLIAAVDRELRLRRRVGQTQPTHPHVVRRPSPN